MLDATTFIGANRSYYSFDLCPGFWDCLLEHFHDGRLLSIDRVRDELLYVSAAQKPAKPDKLHFWTKAAPKDLFVSSNEQLIDDAYTDLMAWVTNHPQFHQEAKDKFARGADGWLIAYAKVHSAVVVTLEVLNLDIKRKVPIPNVCQQFNVHYLNTFEMLRQLDVRFDLRST